MMKKTLLILMFLLMAIPAQAAWKYEVLMNLSRGPGLPRVVQARFTETDRKWSTVITRDDVPGYTTTKQIDLWCASRLALMDKLTVVYDDATGRIGTSISQSGWTAKLLRVSGDLQKPSVLLTLQVSNATSGASSEAVYEIDPVNDYSLANLQVWLKAYLVTVSAKVAEKRTVPTSQDALTSVVGETK